MSNVRSPLRIVQSNWRTGEVDPLAYMRVDAANYPAGARSLTNMMVRQNGATERRPGTVRMRDLGLPAQRLLPFEFDVDEKYVLALSSGSMTILNPDGTLVQVIGSCPWTVDTVWEVNFIQRLDVMILVHPSFQMRRLRRTGLTSFTLETLYFSADASANVYNHPMVKYQAKEVAMAISSIDVGTGRTLSCSSPIFTSAWVGERVRIYDCEILITALVDGYHCTATVMEPVRERLAIAPFRATAGTGAVEITHVQHGLASGSVITITGAGTLFSIPAADLNGDHTISVNDDDHYYIYLGSGSDTSGDGGGGGVMVQTIYLTTRWTEMVFSNRHGWPGAVTMHENRLWLAGNTDLPTFLAGSAVGDYYDFDVGDGFDDESVQAIVSALTRIVHLVSAQQLQIFTENGELIVSTQDGEPITPGTLKVVTQTAYGASRSARPAVFDGATIFVQRNGKNVRELVYQFATNSHVAPPVSLRASHMIVSPYDMAVLLGTSTRPEQDAFFVNADGSVACFHSLRNEELAAWTRFTTPGGSFQSVCVIGSSVYFCVLRPDGHHYLEQLVLDRNDVWLDSAVSLEGASNTVWFAGTGFANQMLTVMNNGYKLGDFQVSASGYFTLQSPVTSVLFGYDYGVSIVPLLYDTSLTDGPSTGEKRRVVSTTIHYHQSVSAAVNGQEQLLHTMGTQDIASPPVPVSEKRRIRMLGYSRDPIFTITQPNPGPLTVLGLTMELSV